jgi:acyl-CoA reductase-like NAD-dependent aldehyde dehydrogenase
LSELAVHGGFVGGSLRIPNGTELLDVVNPATGRTIARLAEFDAAEVDAAVVSARRAFDEERWHRLPVRQRQDVLLAAAARLRVAAPQLAAIETACSGLPLHRSTLRHVSMAADWLRFYAEKLANRAGAVHSSEPGARTLTVYDPRGVAALFAPWNVPLGLAFSKIAPALAAGCSVVLKPSEFTPIATVQAIQILHDCGVPAGVINVVNGRGHVTGAALASHPDVDCISFTGGAAGGRAVAVTAASRHVPAILELGGKSPVVVFEDADLDQALDAALLAAFGNNGQACLAGSRLLLQHSIADAFLTRFVARARQIRVGDPLDASTEVGPLVSESHLASVVEKLSRRRPSARILTGGVRRQDLGAGSYFSPTVVETPDPDDPLVQEEVFGPVVAVQRFSEEREGWQLANGTPFGLAAYLFTRDYPRVLRGIDALRAGSVVVNAAFIRERNAPFGGSGASGTGSEGGDWSMRFYSREKAVVLAADWRSPAPLGA